MTHGEEKMQFTQTLKNDTDDRMDRSSEVRYNFIHTLTS